MIGRGLALAEQATTEIITQQRIYSEKGRLLLDYVAVRPAISWQLRIPESLDFSRGSTSSVYRVLNQTKLIQNKKFG